MAERLMERVCEIENLLKAYRRVKQNKGKPGVDGMTVEELGGWMVVHGPELVRRLMNGSYQPTPVRKAEISKKGGGMRELGIPTVRDRMIQQAISQVLTPMWDPTFSESSYGFRPGRGAHDALRAASRHVKDGHRIVVDIDLEKFFDRVNHDVLMGRVARRISDKRLLKLIRAFLESGIMDRGVWQKKTEGTPQGGPLSPLLSNLLLDELDRELEQRGHRFCRYADDCNIYVRTRKAGKRVMVSITAFLERRLRLHVNRSKSDVAHVRTRKFLGYRLLAGGRLTLAPESLREAKRKIRQHLKRNRPVSLDTRIHGLNRFLIGWMGYFQLAECRMHMKRLDEWIREKLRCVKLKQCKRAFTIVKFLKRCGVETSFAWRLALSGKGWWRKAHTPQSHHAMSNKWFEEQGLVSLEDRYLMLKTRRNRRGTEQVCPVV